MQALIQDIRFAARQLRKNPSFTLTAVLTLAIGIGATTAIFSLVHAVLLRPLPFPQSERLVSMQELVVGPNAAPNTPGIPNEVSYPDFSDWRAQNRSFESMAAYHELSATITDAKTGGSRIVTGNVATAELFHVLGVSPVLGRGFNRDEEMAGNHAVVISHGLWQSDFGSSPVAIGRQLLINSEPYTVVGVMPADFHFPIQVVASELWISSGHDAEGPDSSASQRGWSQLQVIGRLRTGVPLDRARAEMNQIQHALSVQYPKSDRQQSAVETVPELDAVVLDVRPAMRLLFGAVTALLLIACVNVAGLLLARGARRHSELAVRTAMGASRAAIVRQLLVESVLLSLIGGAVGLALASVMLQGLLHYVPKNLPRLDQVSLDAPVMIFSLCVSLLTGLVFGLLPARRMSRLDPAVALRDGARGATSGRGQHRLHSTLVILETAVGLVLLVGAGLLIRSFAHVLHSDPGFDTRNMLTFRIGMPAKRYTDQQRSQFSHQLEQRLAAVPGVRAVTYAYPLPLSGGNIIISFNQEGHTYSAGEQPDSRISMVNWNYMQNMGIPLIRGRFFTEAENSPQSKPVIAINEAFAQKFFPNEDPIGKRISPTISEEDVAPMREIVAIVGNVKRASVTEGPAPESYMLYGQEPVATPSFAMRVNGSPAAYVKTLNSIVASIDKDLPVYRVRTYDDYLGAATAQPRFQTLLITVFAAIALVLAGVGLYAVLSYMVAQRTAEIGLRMALGAQRSGVLQLILRRGLTLAATGVCLGVLVSTVLTRFVSGLLFGVKPLDPLTFVAVSGVLLAVSGLASLAPAWRAARLDPMETLRNQ